MFLFQCHCSPEESTKALQNHRAKLKALRIEDMKASRVDPWRSIQAVEMFVCGFVHVHKMS
jgi:hypothetical protein